MSEKSLLSPLGIHGWEKVEPLVLAGVLLGEPILLVSEPGAAKTFLGQTLAEALSTPERPLSFGYYDISKANFEDIIGFPNPEAFQEGRSEFIHNSLTVWDKNIVMVDEVSRAARDTSNKWLEILGSRMLMGQPLPLRVILGGMNPGGHAGTKQLDEAFADRFLMFIRLPEFVDMPQETRHQILLGQTGLESPSVGFWQGDGDDGRRSSVVRTAEFERGADRLRQVLESAAGHYQDIQSGETHLRISKYTDLLARALVEAGINLEARRLKMLGRAVAATLAVRMAALGQPRGETPRLDDLGTAAALVCSMSMPHPYTASGELTSEQLDAAHLQAAPALRDDVSQLMLFQSTSQAGRLRMLFSQEYPPTVQEKVCADFLADQSLEADMTAWVVAQLLLAPQATVLPAHCLDKLSKRFRECEERMSRTSSVQLQANSQIADQYQAYQRVAELIEEVEARAVDTAAPRIACAWALGQADGDPERILDLYPQALQALQDAMSELQPLCRDWDIEGAAEWAPEQI